MIPSIKAFFADHAAECKSIGEPQYIHKIRIHDVVAEDNFTCGQNQCPLQKKMVISKYQSM